MEFLGEKLNSYSASALSGINELKRKRRQKQTNEASENKVEEKNLQTLREPSAKPYSSFSNSIPFGGDSFTSAKQQIPQAPPIGFRTDLLETTTFHSQQQQQQQGSKQEPIPQPQPDTAGKRHNVSESSLYEGDTWNRLWFQRVMILTLIRLLLFISKIYEDFQATKVYKSNGNLSYYILGLATLFAPTIVFTIYRVARYLQIALPGTRYQQAITSNSPVKSTEPTTVEDDEVKKSLLKGALQAGDQSRSQQEEEGLVTARQTPTVFEEFHDSKSQQEQQVASPSSPPPSAAIAKDPIVAVEETRKTVSLEKLGHLPDGESVRISIGASEQLLHGVLYVFWQLKRQVDVIGYLVERSCLWRKPKEQEKEELERMRTGSDGLEWFQDFYAAFLAILAQVYTLALNWSPSSTPSLATLSSASPSLAGLASKEASELSISNTAKALSNTLQQQLLVENTLSTKDLLIMSQLLVSSAVVFSLLIAVRRRDDGPLTLGLSMLGWGSIFASRIIIISLSFVHIGAIVIIPLIFCHILGITIWLYKIAIDSHNGKRGESEESTWDPAVENEENQQALEMESGTRKQNSGSQLKPTDSWSLMEHVVLMLQVLTLFAIPSLFYWPIMFNLKLHCRPFKYLVLILSENFLLVLGILYYIVHTATTGQWYLLGAAGAFSILGFIFVSLYVSCKPSLTEYFARADELFNEAEKSGIYFEFCSRVFKMPDLSKQTFQRLLNQTGPVEEIEIVDEEDDDKSQR